MGSGAGVPRAHSKWLTFRFRSAFTHLQTPRRSLFVGGTTSVVRKYPTLFSLNSILPFPSFLRRPIAGRAYMKNIAASRCTISHTTLSFLNSLLPSKSLLLRITGDDRATG